MYNSIQDIPGINLQGSGSRMSASEMVAQTRETPLLEKAASLLKRLMELGKQIDRQSNALVYQEPQPGCEKGQMNSACLEAIVNECHQTMNEIERIIAYNDAKLGLK